MQLYMGSEAQKKQSFMWDHNVRFHEGRVSDNMMDDFEMIMVEQFRKPLSRILDEGLRIRNLENDDFITRDEQDYKRVVCLNSRDEYFQSEYVRVGFSRGNREPGHALAGVSQ